MKKWINNIGPGPLVAAAFIGPGTVTLCSIAGVDFGFSLLWTLVLSIIATIVLQEMSARLGIISNKGRYIVSSFLINDLNLDWTLGAEYFNKILLNMDKFYPEPAERFQLIQLALKFKKNSNYHY